MKILIKMGIAKIKIIETLHNSRTSQDIDGARTLILFNSELFKIS